MNRAAIWMGAAVAFSVTTVGLAEVSLPPLILAGDHVLIASVNGKEMRLQVRPDGVSLPVINPAVATALALKPSMTRARTVVGRTMIRGFTDAAKVRLDGGERKLRIVWFDRPLIEGSDGVVGPAALSAPIVIFQLRPAQPGETELVLPVEDFGPSGMPTRLAVGDLKIQVFFNLQTEQTVVSAAVGAALARLHGGEMTGEAFDLRVDFDVKRPVRAMRFLHQPRLVGLPLSNIVVRSADASTATIPDAEADPNEIVVTGTDPKKRSPRYRIAVGLRALEPCSSLTFDKPAKVIRLSCKLPG